MAPASEAAAAALLARLVACRTVAGDGGNGKLLAVVGEALEGTGAVVDVVDGTRSGVGVLHAVLGPADAPGGLLLAAHGDVVDVEGQAWTSDPFRLRVEDGRLFGRGTTDMKGFLAAALYAMAAADGRTLRAPVHLALSHDEELGCAGVAPLLSHLVGGGVAAPLRGVIVGEPTEMRAVDRHKGKAALEVVLHGRAAHSATPGEGVNAVVAAARVIAALEALQDELAGEASDASFGVPHATIGIGPIAGGVAVNIVPETCRLKVETRVLPGQDVEAVVRRMTAAARHAAESMGASASVDVVASYPPLTPDKASHTFARSLTSEPPAAVDFGTEAGLYQHHLAAPTIILGPGSMLQGHTPDEFLTTSQLTSATTFLTNLLTTLR